MNFEYETKRLILRIVKPSYEATMQILHFYNRNRILFEHYEATRSDDFYTPERQNLILTAEYNLFIQKKGFRFWVFEKNNPQYTIGAICFYNIDRFTDACCETGYKFDAAYRRKGYAKEAMTLGISLMFNELNLQRIHAYVMEDNEASIRLLRSLNFKCEEAGRKSICIRGQWEDHILYTRIR